MKSLFFLYLTNDLGLTIILLPLTPCLSDWQYQGCSTYFLDPRSTGGGRTYDDKDRICCDLTSV